MLQNNKTTRIKPNNNKGVKQRKMTEIPIYRFQLEAIVEALRITQNIHDSSKGKTCHDRQVRMAYQYAKNALEGNKDIQISYSSGKPINP